MGKVIKAKLVSKTFPDGKESAAKTTIYPENGSWSCPKRTLRPDSLLLLAKLSVNSLWCPNPQGEFIGCSEISLEQKKNIRSERRMTPTAEYRFIVRHCGLT